MLSAFGELGPGLYTSMDWMQAIVGKGVTLDKAAPFRRDNPQEPFVSRTPSSWESQAFIPEGARGLWTHA